MSHTKKEKISKTAKYLTREQVIEIYKSVINLIFEINLDNRKEQDSRYKLIKVWILLIMVILFVLIVRGIKI